MRLESALLASREGVTAHGQAISVVGDNIANANTIGFKTSRAEFADLLGEVGGETGSLATTGSGVTVNRVRQIHETGVIEPTGRPLDMAIAGAGFFMAGTPENISFTRAGNFFINDAGNLTTADGLEVLGTTGDAATLTPLNMLNLNLTGEATTTLGLFGNISSSAPVLGAPPANPATFNELAAGSSFIASNLTVYDSLGTAHPVSVAFTKTGANQWAAQAFVDGAEVGGAAGQPVQLGATANLTFGENGTIDPANAAAAVITGTPAWGNGAAAGNFTIDLSSFSQVATTSQVSSITQDGQGTGQIVSYEVGKDGTLAAVLASGDRATIGIIQLATFPNIDGLQRIGNGMFRASENTGEISFGVPGADGRGGIEGASVERSTVDIANQFVDLVVLQRGYQANSQAMSAANDLLRDTISLIR